MERLFPELEKYSTDDIVTIALEKQDGIVNINESALENSHLMNEKSNLTTPLKEHHKLENGKVD